MKQIQFEFRREQDKNGRFKTKKRFILTNDYSRERHRGVIHKAYHLKDRVKGDVPSIERKLNAVNPTTVKGVVGISAAKGAYKFVKTSAKITVKTALIAEDLTLAAKDLGTDKLKQKTKGELEGNNIDTAKGAIKIGNFLRAAQRHFRERRIYKGEKKRFKARTEDFKFIRKAPRLMLKEEHGRFLTEKQKYKRFKESYKRADKAKTSNVRKAMMFRRKQQYKAAKKEYRVVLRDYLKLDKALVERVEKQWKIKRLSKPHMIPTKILMSATNSYWNKLTTADPDNDIMEAASKTVDATKKAHRAVKSARIKAARHCESKYEKSLHKQQGRFAEREQRLNKPPKKLRAKNDSWKNPKRSSETLADYAKRLLASLTKNVKAAVKNAASKLLISMLPMVFFLIIVGMVCMLFLGIFSETEFVLGTYTADDEQLSDAVESYTLIARNFNQAIDEIDDDSVLKSWKKSLKALGVNTDDYNTKPASFVYGRSSAFDYEPAEYDFDPYVLWSFLSAYNYDFDESQKCADKGETYEPDYWEMDSAAEDLLKELFYTEYSFEHFYTDSSHWAELSEYNVLPNDEGGREGAYYTIYYDFSHTAFRYRKISSDIKTFAKDGWIHYDENTLEILNAKDNDKRTGWFLQDQRVSIGSRISFYTINQYGQYYCYGTDRERTPCSWAGGDDIWFCVSPWDSYDFNNSFPNPDEVGESEAVCLVSFYQKNKWVNSAQLFYNVRKNCTFKEAAESILSSMSYKSERLEYFNLLVGDDTTSRHGNHQCMQSPVNVNMQELINTGRIYNSFGYDISEWNTTHCGIGHNNHNGLDITCNVGEDIYSMLDGEVKEVSDNSVTVFAEDFELVYSNDKNGKSRKYDITVTIDNVYPCVAAGDTVAAGEIIGTATNARQCNNADNSGYSTTYIHVLAKIEKSFLHYFYAAPELLIY